MKTPAPIRHHFSLFQYAKKCFWSLKTFNFCEIFEFLRFSSRIRFDKWMPKLHKSWTINFWKWRDAERWRKVNYSVVMVDTKPPLVHQGAIQFMENWNSKFQKISLKIKMVEFNGHNFKRSINYWFWPLWPKTSSDAIHSSYKSDEEGENFLRSGQGLVRNFNPKKFKSFQTNQNFVFGFFWN